MGNRRGGKGNKKKKVAAATTAERSPSGGTAGAAGSVGDASFLEQHPLSMDSAPGAMSHDASRADDDEPPRQHTISANLIVNTHAVYALTMLDTEDYASTEELEGDLLSFAVYGGSVSSSHVQNQVRELPFYAAVFNGGVRPSWQAFIEAHRDKWSLVKYTKEQIEEHDIGVTCRARELRMYANEHAECYIEGDVARDRIRVAAEKELHEVLLERLRERPYEQSELLKELVNERSFLTLMTLNFVKIMGMYEALPDQYFVLCDALYPITIEPRAKQLPPEHNGKGAGGGLRYDRVRRVWVAPTETAAHERSSRAPAPAGQAGVPAAAPEATGDADDDQGAARP